MVSSQVTPVAVAGTFLSLAAVLSVTAHIAARNVLGDIPWRNALAVGPVPAAVAVAGTALAVSPAITVPVALAADGVLIQRVYQPGRRLAAYITFIHAVVSVIAGALVVSAFLVLRTAPA